MTCLPESNLTANWHGQRSVGCHTCASEGADCPCVIIGVCVSSQRRVSHSTWDLVGRRSLKGDLSLAVSWVPPRSIKSMPALNPSKAICRLSSVSLGQCDFVANAGALRADITDLGLEDRRVRWSAGNLGNQGGDRVRPENPQFDPCCSEDREPRQVGAYLLE